VCEICEVSVCVLLYVPTRNLIKFNATRLETNPTLSVYVFMNFVA